MEQTFRKNLSDLRQKRQLTQEELARKIGVTRQAISKWERGDGMPDLYNVSKLAKALDVTVDELIGKDASFNKKDEPRGFDFNQTGNYLKKLLYKAKHVSNQEQAKVLRKKLLTFGIIGVIIGGLMTAIGFFGFAAGAMSSVGSMEPFNPLPFVGLFMFSATITGISVYLIYGGLTIVVAGVATKYLDTREKCPKCGDEIDPDEKRCSKCGYDLEANVENRCICGKLNEPKDSYCRECGQKLREQH